MCVGLLCMQIDKLSKDICENETVKKVAVEVAPIVVNGVVTATTGNPVLGKAGAEATKLCAKADEKFVAEMVVGVGLMTVGQLVSFITTPIFLGWCAWQGVKHVAKKYPASPSMR